MRARCVQISRTLTRRDSQNIICSYSFTTISGAWYDEGFSSIYRSIVTYIILLYSNAKASNLWLVSVINRGLRWPYMYFLYVSERDESMHSKLLTRVLPFIHFYIISYVCNIFVRIEEVGTLIVSIKYCRRPTIRE